MSIIHSEDSELDGLDNPFIVWDEMTTAEQLNECAAKVKKFTELIMNPPYWMPEDIAMYVRQRNEWADRYEEVYRKWVDEMREEIEKTANELQRMMDRVQRNVHYLYQQRLIRDRRPIRYYLRHPPRSKAYYLRRKHH